jgi:hypothetical protein
MPIIKEIRDNATDYCLDSIKHICNEIGPRESGSPNERKAQEWLKGQVLENGWADEATLEEFPVVSKALVGFTKIISPLMAVAALLQLVPWLAGGTAAIVTGAVSLLLIAFSLITFVMQFLLY